MDFEEFIIDAIKGNADAQYELGKCYYIGLGTEKNYNKAVDWWLKASVQGNEHATKQLKECYEFTTHQNIADDQDLRLRPISKMSVCAQNSLAVCYANGKGVKRNYNVAIELFEKAAKQGDTNAYYNLGLCYANGRGVRQNYLIAVRWWTKAGEKGNVYAQINLGVSYENGYGVQQDYVKAAEWYIKAAEQGNEIAKKYIFELYSEVQSKRSRKHDLIWDFIL